MLKSMLASLALPGVGNPTRTHCRAHCPAEPAAKVKGGAVTISTHGSSLFKSEGQVQLYVTCGHLRDREDSVSNPKNPTLQRDHQTMPSPRNYFLR